MKSNQVKSLPEKEEKKPCIICGKLVTAFYGNWGNSGTCSKKCEHEQEAKSQFFFDGSL